MSYKIAVVSSDGIHIDETFGLAKEFIIYEVTKENYIKSEVRKLEKASSVQTNVTQSQKASLLQGGCENSNNCGKGCCSSGDEVSKKIEKVLDCRCVVCKKIGFHIQKQLERKAIASFDVDCTVEEALRKITTYFYKVDTHQSFRRTSTKD